MRRGLRYLPVTRNGGGRLGVLGLGLLALVSLVWQQQATLATYLDTEYGTATFKSDKLAAITPTLSASPTSIQVSWPEPQRKWGTQEYRVNWSPAGSGTGTNFYTGPYPGSVKHSTGSAQQTDEAVAFTAVAAGSTHACGIARGTVYCWGTSTSYGLGLGTGVTVKATPTAVTGGELGAKPATAIAAGADFTCAIAEGRAYCWGRGDQGQLGIGGQVSQPTPKLVSALADVTSISAGAAHACAIAGGKAYCWGAGGSGQLGEGSTSRKESPVAVKTDTGGLAGRRLATISAGGSHTCAVADGQAFCWGLNSSGQLGDASTTQSLLPVAVSTSGVLMGRTVSAVATGANHTCALADGQAFCWGLGTSGELGNGASASSSRPVAVASSSGATQIASGSQQTCFVAGGFSCWGKDIGNRPTSYTGTISGRTVTAISVGTAFGCVAAAGQPAACAGDGTGHRLGNGSTATTTAFVDVDLKSPTCPEGAVRIGTGCSLPQGTEYYYRLGYSIGSWVAPDSAWRSATTTSRPAVTLSAVPGPERVALSWTEAQDPGQSYAEYTLERALPGDSGETVVLATTGSRAWVDWGGLAPTRKFTAVSAGSAHSCGIVAGELYCWGNNGSGQLGVGGTANRTEPTRVGGLLADKDVTAVSAGQNHTCAIAQGKAYCWGDNSSGQLGSTSASSVPVAVSVSGVLAQKTVTAISAGSAHSCVVASGRAYCWGSNSSGQLGNGATGGTTNAPVAVITSGVLGTQTVTDVSAGGSHSCAVAGNKAYCWGSNRSGQLGGNTGWWGLVRYDSDVPIAVITSGQLSGKSVSQVAAGGLHTCVVASAEAYCWGEDGSGQLGNNSQTTDSVQPARVSATQMPGTVAMVSAGNSHSCAVAGEKAYCWGAGANGRLGSAASANSAVPVPVAANGALASAKVSFVAAGGAHSCAVADSDAYCWGNGDNGRLGNRTTAASSYPVAVLADVRCAPGSTALGNGTCSLATGATYRYRVSFTLDGDVSTPGAWESVTVG